MLRVATSMSNVQHTKILLFWPSAALLPEFIGQTSILKQLKYPIMRGRNKKHRFLYYTVIKYSTLYFHPNDNNVVLLLIRRLPGYRIPFSTYFSLKLVSQHRKLLLYQMWPRRVFQVISIGWLTWSLLFYFITSETQKLQVSEEGYLWNVN